MNWRILTALVLESAVGAQLALFAAFLLTGAKHGPPARYLLAALAGCLALMLGGNLLIEAAGWLFLSDLVLCLDLLAPPIVYLYLRQIHYPPAPMHRRDVLHALPALAGLFVRKMHLLSSMDVYVNVCWFGYIALAVRQFATFRRGYAPEALRNVLAMLLFVLLAIGVLRIVIVLQASQKSQFQEGLPYLLILSSVFLATCRILFTALSHPDLLSVPGSNVKYASSTASEADLLDLNRRLLAVLRNRKPYLDPDVTLAGLASYLDAPTRHVSELINSQFGMGFPAYMNYWRAKTASEILAGEPDKPIKLVMFESGFRSKSIFNREFQRHFALTPGQYRNLRTRTAPQNAEP